MKEYPIIMSAPMVRALLDGRKTQTRRLVTSQWSNLKMHHDNGTQCQLWVRETYAVGKCADIFTASELSCRVWKGEKGGIWYNADNTVYGTPFSPKGKNRPSIFMVRWASRITLNVTDVRLQRLRGISDEDCFSEGIDPEEENEFYNETYRAAEHYQAGGSPIRGGSPERCVYADLWESLHGAGSWDANPEVVAISFNVNVAGR